MARQQSQDNDNQTTAVAVMSEKMSNVEKSLEDMRISIKEILNKLDKNYVTKDELAVVDKKAQESKDAIRWFAILVISSVILAVLGLVLTKQV